MLVRRCQKPVKTSGRRADAHTYRPTRAGGEWGGHSGISTMLERWITGYKCSETISIYSSADPWHEQHARETISTRAVFDPTFLSNRIDEIEHPEIRASGDLDIWSRAAWGPARLTGYMYILPPPASPAPRPGFSCRVKNTITVTLLYDMEPPGGNIKVVWLQTRPQYLLPAMYIVWSS